MPELTENERRAFTVLLGQKELDKGALTIHPHDPAKWGVYLTLKALVRKGYAEVEYNDAVCINGWVAEFYEKSYYTEVS